MIKSSSMGRMVTFFAQDAAYQAFRDDSLKVPCLLEGSLFLILKVVREGYKSSKSSLSVS
jgi:hypothetical protein